MKMYCIACGVFRKDLEQIIPTLQDKPQVHYLEGGLHAEPDLLRRELQNAIDGVPDGFDRIILLYGVCGKGIVGLKSDRYPMVIPKVHDCISLFLGGSREYRKQFSHKPGTYYISPGWYEEQVQPRGKVKKNNMHLPKEYIDTLDKEVLKDRFGQENSDAVSDFFDAWKKNYTRAVFIDTGIGNSKKYADYARTMAQENNWEYQCLLGSQNLILQCFSEQPEQGQDDVLIVPPGHEIIFDSPSGLIQFASASGGPMAKKIRTLILEGHNGDLVNLEEEPRAVIGLGIDTGGTYTDAVLFDFKTRKILSRAKSLTTKWKYSDGIMNAVKKLPDEILRKIDQVSLSTTLVTNAIVESNLYPVGLFLMPLGNTLPDNIHHKPSAVIKGRMTIEGQVDQEIDPAEIIDKAREMISSYGVKAFAVSGYGASINPALELAVKSLLRKSTGMNVCCGHELSGTLNFYVRAHTAVLNAGVIPIMEEFLDEMKLALAGISLDVPCLVVKGDGSVMTGNYAGEFPVQTALSGPASSMAGARYLTGRKNALVIDVGGTTSDIGYLEEGEIRVCEEGANIGSWRTHVKAVDMVTTGLGGDSAVLFSRGEWIIGPERITPFCWLNSEYGLKEKLKQAEPLVDVDSSIPLQWLYKTSKNPDFQLTRQEREILELLEHGPELIKTLSSSLTHGVWTLLKTDRLEKSYCIQRAGLTPTDLYHIQGSMNLWPGIETATYFQLIINLQNEPVSVVLKGLSNMISHKLGRSILERIFPEASGNPAVFNPILERGNSLLQVTPALNVPVIGLGAPAGLVLKEAVELLGGELILPENGDVANAIGAITSKVMINDRAQIIPTAEGLYRIQGMEGYNDFETLEEAEVACLKGLAERTRMKALKAGTSQQSVRVSIYDKTAESSGGDILFLQRQFSSVLKGFPDRIF